MTKKTVFTLLGTGSSGGVPRVGNQWGSCDPGNPKNRRRRCALLVENQDSTARTSVLIDAGADLREQLLASQVTHLDGVLITHAHADHIFGLDDLRQLAINMRSSIRVYMDETTEETVLRAFHYVFQQAPGSSYPAFCELLPIQHNTQITISGAAGNLTAQPVVADHGDIHALGFRIGNVAYLPDMKRIKDQENLDALTGLDTLIVDALRHAPHPAHMNLEESLAFIELVKPKQAILTNMHSDLDYKTLCESLPEHIRPGYDGLTIEVVH